MTDEQIRGKIAEFFLGNITKDELESYFKTQQSYDRFMFNLATVCEELLAIMDE